MFVSARLVRRRPHVMNGPLARCDLELRHGFLHQPMQLREFATGELDADRSEPKCELTARTLRHMPFRSVVALRWLKRVILSQVSSPIREVKCRRRACGARVHN